MGSRRFATSLIKARPGTILNYNFGACPSDMQQFMNQSYVFKPISASLARLQQKAGNLTRWHTLFPKACRVSKHKSKRSKSRVCCCAFQKISTMKLIGSYQTAVDHWTIFVWRLVPEPDSQHHATCAAAPACAWIL
jgi:hypothetical protein